MQDRRYFVYIVTNRPQGVIYTGITSNITRRAQEHRDRQGAGFAAKYNCCQLVWAEQHNDVREAIQREKRIKKWNRAWKVALIEAVNPDWRDIGVLGI